MEIQNQYIKILLSQAIELENILFWKYQCGMEEPEILGPVNHILEELQLPKENKCALLTYSQYIFPEEREQFLKILSGNFPEESGTYSYRLNISEEIKYHRCRYERMKAESVEIIIGTIVDETAKIKSQEKETIFEYIARYSNIGIYSYSPLTGKAYISEKWYDNFGLRQELSLKEAMHEFGGRIHPEDWKRVRHAGQELRNGKKLFMDEVFRIYSAGIVKWVRYIAVIRKYNDGKNIQVIGMNEDVTHVKKQEERNQKILEALPDFIFIFDNNFFICDLYKSAEIQLFHTEEELIGGDGRDFFAGDVSELYIKSIKHCLESGSLVEIEYYLDAQGARHYFQARMVPFEDNKVLALIHNIGDRVKRTQELVAAKQKAETADKLKSGFLANMSHEIRTPLNAIVGFSDLLMAATEPEEREEYMQIIRMNNELLLKLINDILDLSKIEAGPMELKYEEFDLAEYFNDIYISIQQSIRNPNIRLLSVNPYSSCVVKLDKSRFAQILTNYLTNAVKYTLKGFIEMGYEEVDEGIRVYVKDSGIGIADDKKDKVFSRFEKLDEFAQGTGLGLSICKAIAEACGGRVGFESEFGQGTLFWAFLPCVVKVTGKKKEELEPKAAIREKVAVRGEAGQNDRKVILVAEDIQSNYLLISALLKKDYDLIHVTNGKDAVEAVGANPEISLVLMDMKMPGMDGMVATCEIRKFNPEIPIVALTAHAFDTDREAALAAGCDDYLVKPVEKAVLMTVLQKYC